MDPILIAIISGVAGLGLGGVVVYLIADRKARARLSETGTARAVAEQKAAGLAADAARLTAEHTSAIAALESEIARERGTADSIRVELAACSVELARAKTELQSSRTNILEQKKILDDANTKLTQAFAAVSQDALTKNTANFLEMAKARFETLSTEAAGNLDARKAQIATLLKPLEEVLAAYQKRLGEIEIARTSAYSDLLKQVVGMSTTQQTLAIQTTQLATALKKSNVRGRWGEIALQRLAEMAGMTEHVDFALQESTVNDDGRTLRPDMTVKLPGNRSVVVDSKAVMNAFLDAMAITDEAARAELMKTHSRNVRSRIDDLASKAYWKQFANAPDCVVLFLPGESFLYAACESDPDLIEYGLSQRVFLATPTTFLILLKSFELGWRQEAISENAEEIRKLGTDIYDRLAILAENMSKLGNSLDSAVENYNKTLGTLESRVLVSARKISELGAHTDRQLKEPEAIDKRAREVSAELRPDSPALPGK